MYIIFGNDEVDTIKQKYTVLELDTIRIGEHEPRTAHCVLQAVPFDDIPVLEHLKTLHSNLITNYGRRGWKLCLQAIEQLQGKWGGELDSFYNELHTRIQQYQLEEPGPDWTPIIIKT
jgi:hypothetical protein